MTGAELKTKRTDRGLSQAAVARWMGCSPVMVGYLERTVSPHGDRARERWTHFYLRALNILSHGCPIEQPCPSCGAEGAQPCSAGCTEDCRNMPR